MKNFAQILFLGVFIASSASAAENYFYHVGVDGLACPFCAYGIEKQLLRIEGVLSAETDIEQGVVLIRTDGNVDIEHARIEQAVENAGFSLRFFRRAEQPSNTNPEQVQ